MSVLLMGMEMPTNCWDRQMLCNCSTCEGYPCFCAALNKDVGTEDEVPHNKRRDDCPLVPVQKHGRLIDADALEYHADNVRDPMGRTEKTVMWKKIEAAPTIIPAEPFNNLSKPCKEEGET